MKRILTAVALTAFAAAGAAGTADTAGAADTGGLNPPSVVLLSGVLTPGAKPAGTPGLPPVNAAVERLLPGGR
ncbi:hypothetical protein [Streptomyces sp. bgisy095]|uniref:hypothetical protein n=1 Tax=unclassified Streptomyces TaxID=2593676 RepID=UPI003D721785